MIVCSRPADVVVDRAADARAVRRVLARVARHVWRRRALRSLLRSIAAALCGVIVVLLAHTLGLVSDPRGAPLAWAAGMVVIVVTLPGLRPVGLRSAAAMADRACALGERLTTAVEVIERPGAMEHLVIRDAARCAADLDPDRLPRTPYAREAAIAVSALVIATVLWLQPVARPPDVARSDAPGFTGEVGADGVRDGNRARGGASRRVAGALEEALRMDSEARDVQSSAPLRPTSSGEVSRAIVASDSPMLNAGAGVDTDRGAGADTDRGAAADLGRGVATGSDASGADRGVSTAGTAPAAGLGLGRTVSAAGAPGAAVDDSPPQSRSTDQRGTGTGDDHTRPPRLRAETAPLAPSRVPTSLRTYVERYFERLHARGAASVIPPRSER